MLVNIFYIILALVGLGFLVFIHELGHYFVAKKVGMKIEVFSIGFGKAIYSWKHKGIQWQISMLPFGGYVKIAGMEKKGKKEPYQIKGGFFNKKPKDRIKVALSGPFVNFLFAFLVFSVIWIFGGREQPFSRHTKKIGWVDPTSPLHKKKVQAGDEITFYNQKKYLGFKDLIYASALKKEVIPIQGWKKDYYQQTKTPYDYSLKTYLVNGNFYSIGIQAPASFLIYQEEAEKQAPITASGIQKGDRILWVDGEIIFSMPHLASAINDVSTFLTIRRKGSILQVKVPKVKIDDIVLKKDETAEIDDWRHEANIKKALKDLFFIPYFIGEKGIVERALSFVDEEETWLLNTRNPFSFSLEKGDQIIAVDGKKVLSSFDILSLLQKKYSQIIVERKQEPQKISWKEGDRVFDTVFQQNDLKKLIQSIGVPGAPQSFNHLHLLKRVEPVTLENLAEALGKDADLSQELASFEKEIGKIKNAKKRTLALSVLQDQKNKLVLGIPFLQDEQVKYNPNPLFLFSNSFLDGWRTLGSLISGRLSPKWIMGPVGIVQVVQKGWSLGILEAFFWLGVISLNLGFVNLLPIPVLDGGHIILSFIEMVTKKPMKAKTMEKLIIPFFVLLIVAFIFITYNDLVRWIKGFF